MDDRLMLSVRAPIDGLAGNFLRGPDTRCVRDDREGWISRDQLWEVVEELRNRILDLAPGIVFLFTQNDLASLVGLLASWAAGQPVALLDPALPNDAVAQLLAIYHPEILLGYELDDSSYRCIRQESGTRPRIHLACSPIRQSIHPDLALLLSTSGSTGSPKFVRLSHSAVAVNARQIAEALAITSDDIGIAHLPMHYSYGLSIATSHLIAGASVSLMAGRVTEPTFWRRIGEDGGTHFPGVPFHYSVLDRLGIKRLVPASVRTFTQAGGHLDHQTRWRCYEAIVERGGRFYVMYGQTEAGPRITTLQSDEFPENSSSVGSALSGGHLLIIGDDGKAELPGIEGNVVYQGPNVMMGYATSREDLALPDMLAGRLETGDRGTLSSDGILTLTGRTQRFAKIAGLRIALDEIESLLGSTGSIAALASNERILLYLKPSAGQDIAEGVRRFACRLHLPSAVFVTRLVEDLPLKANGKIDYKALERLG
jgi:acyl-coenzyme A synthetase/AMP-(fatty) acid ligase